MDRIKELLQDAADHKPAELSVDRLLQAKEQMEQNEKKSWELVDLVITSPIRLKKRMTRANAHRDLVGYMAVYGNVAAEIKEIH